MSKIIPNTFQTPNAHVDLAMRYLTGDQYKILNFAVRHIYGWQDRPERYEGRIALSVFLEGFITEEGTHYYGCGLSRNTIIEILKDLTRFDLLVRVGEPTEDGQRWSIGRSPNWDLIATEYAKRAEVNAARAQKMNAARDRKRQGVSSHETVSSHDTPPVSSHETGGVSSHEPPPVSSHETHIKPCESHGESHDKNHLSASGDAVTGDSPKASSKGRKKKSAPADSSDAAATDTTDPLSPHPLSPAADGAAKLPSFLAVIAYNWQRNEGFAQGLIGQLVGTVKNGERAKFKIIPAMSRDEIMAYGTWFRRRNPTAKSLPQKADWLWESVTEFRAESDHAVLVVQGAQDVVRYLMPREGAMPTTTSSPVVPSSEAAARLKALQDRLLAPSRQLREVQS